MGGVRRLERPRSVGHFRRRKQVGASAGGELARCPRDRRATTTRHENEYRYRFGAHAFRFGEYVSTEDTTGEFHTFRVVLVALVA